MLALVIVAVDRHAVVHVGAKWSVANGSAGFHARAKRELTPQLFCQVHQYLCSGV